MKRIFVLLGGAGDLCIMFPFFKAEAERIGEPVNVLVAEAYVGLFDGITYAVPVTCPADFQDLLSVMKWMRSAIPDVPAVVLQYSGRPHEAGLPSFVDEIWYNSGQWKGWQDKPLVFDRRDEDREQKLVDRVLEGPGRPVVLVGTKGRSSPFQHSKQLLKRLRKEFGKSCRIISLDKIKATRAYDLLGLYDRAAALVSIDTLHLHLSRASSVPVFALSRDFGTRWHGTPHQERFAFHCRYSDYPRREDEFMQALRETLEGKREKIALKPCMPKGFYNPAIFKTANDFMTVARHPHAGSWQTRLQHESMLGHHDIELPRAWDKHSHEDLRFFEHGGEVWASLTLSICKKKQTPRCVTAYGKMNPEGNIPKLFIPKFGRNDFSWMEKNWVFFSHGGKVHAIYSCHPYHQVLELDGEKVVQQYVTPMPSFPRPSWPYGEIRGGTPPVRYGAEDGGLWLRFFHSRIWDQKPQRKPRTKVEKIFHPTDRIPWRYYVGALVMESEPPFRVLQVSSSPILTGNEQWVPGCPHWKPNVIIPYGCVPTDGGWTVSLGVNDALACLAHIKPEQLKLT